MSDEDDVVRWRQFGQWLRHQHQLDGLSHGKLAGLVRFSTCTIVSLE